MKITKGLEHHGYDAYAAHKLSDKMVPCLTPQRSQEDEDGNNPALPLFSFYESHIANSITRVYISQNIGAPAVYIPLIQFLSTRQRGDVVHIHLNCYGGRLDAGIQIVTAIMNTQATVVAHLDGVAYSMAAVMFLSCDAHVVSPYGKLMLHTYSGGGGGGKAPDQRAAQNAIDETYAKIIQNICIPFLTKREVKDMLENSRDLYFGYEEIMERLNPAPKKAPKKAAKPSARDLAEVQLLEEMVELEPGEAVEVFAQGAAVVEDAAIDEAEEAEREA